MAPFLVGNGRAAIPSFWAISFLLAPALIFLLSWVRPTIGIPIAAALVFAVSRFKPSPADHRATMTLAAVGFSCVVLYIVGFGVGRYCWDWFKHWALLNTIAEGPWPTEVTLQDQTLSLRFYIAAYLIPGLIHKILPLVSVKSAAAIGFGIGYAAVFLTVARATPGRSAPVLIATACVAMTLTGADFLAGNLWRALGTIRVNDLFGLHYEWWFAHVSGHLVQFPSMIAALLWVPHQSVATIIVALIWASATSMPGLRAALLAYGALSLWSPFGMLGLLPLVATVLWIERRQVFALPLLLYAAVALAFSVTVASYIAHDSPPVGLSIAAVANNLAAYPDYLPFLIVELTPYALLLRRRILREPVLLASVVTLALLPILEGRPGDLVMRASIGPLAVLSLAAAQALLDDLRAGRWRLGLVALLLSVPTVGSEIAYHVQRGAAYQRLAPEDPMDEPWARVFATGEQIGLQEFFDTCGWRYVPQYFSSDPARVLRVRRAGEP